MTSRVARLVAAALVAGLLGRAAPVSAPYVAPPPPPPPPPEPVVGFRPLPGGLAVARELRPYDPDASAVVHVVRLPVTRVRARVEPVPARRFSQLPRPESELLAVNGGFFEPDFAPSGLVVSGGVTLAPPALRGGSGVLLLTAGRASIAPYTEPFELPAGVEIALQCGPRLVEPGGVLGIRRDDGRRAARTALCVRDGGRTLDVVVTHRDGGYGGPSLFTLATWLVQGLPAGEPPCEAALNLDGGPSTAMRTRDAAEAYRLPPGDIVHALVFDARE